MRRRATILGAGLSLGLGPVAAVAAEGLPDAAFDGPFAMFHDARVSTLIGEPAAVERLRLMRFTKDDGEMDVPIGATRRFGQFIVAMLRDGETCSLGQSRAGSPEELFDGLDADLTDLQPRFSVRAVAPYTTFGSGSLDYATVRGQRGPIDLVARRWPRADDIATHDLFARHGSRARIGCQTWPEDCS